MCNVPWQAALDAAGVLARVEKASTPRKALVVHRLDSQQTVPKTAQILEQRNQRARIDGDLALSRQALCSVLHEILLEEDLVSAACLRTCVNGELGSAFLKKSLTGTHALGCSNRRAVWCDGGIET